MNKVQVSILRLFANSQGTEFAVILNEIDGERKIPIVIGAYEAQSIALRLENQIPPRPFTHDLLCNILDKFEIKVREVFIHAMQNETFYAKIICEQSSEDVYEIDARPSDAISVAIRTDAAIFVSEDVIEKTGIKVENNEIVYSSSEDAKASVAPTNSKEISLTDLKKKMQEAIAKENYEEAAKLRDEIQRRNLLTK